MKKLFLVYLLVVAAVCGCTPSLVDLGRPVHTTTQPAAHWERPPIDTPPPRPPLSFAGIHPIQLAQSDLTGWMNANGLSGVVDSYVHIRHGHWDPWVATSVLLTQGKVNVTPDKMQLLISDRAYTAANSETITLETKDGWCFILYHLTDTTIRL